jgi:hypothetical protein
MKTSTCPSSWVLCSGLISRATSGRFSVAAVADPHPCTGLLWQLAAIRVLGVLEDEELAGLSAESRRQVESLAGEALRPRS